MISRGLLQRRLRQMHFWLGAVIGAQVLLWLGSGLFMVMFDINVVRGDHLRADEPTTYLSENNPIVPPEIALASVPFPAETALLTTIRGETVWIVESGPNRVILDGKSGEAWSTISSEVAQSKALAAYAGRGELVEAKLLDEAPKEFGGRGPIWAVTFGPKDKATLYLDPLTGDLKKVRTPLWRAFDFAWGLHIMDWDTRENFNSWWIKATAVFGMIFALAGAGLVATRLTRVRR